MLSPSRASSFRQFFSVLFVFILAVGFCPFAFSQQSFIQGVQDYQVFPYETGGIRARIPFRVGGGAEGAVGALVKNRDTGQVVAEGSWIIDSKAAPKTDPPADKSQPIRTSLRDLYIDRVPINIDAGYRIEFTLGGRKQSFDQIMVGELWIVGGGVNAMGAPSRRNPDTIPTVRIFDGTNWKEAKEPLFEPYEALARQQIMIGPWLTAAVRYSQSTRMPVGILGATLPNQPIAAWWNAEGTELTAFKRLIETQGRGAQLFAWFQGYHDAGGPLAAQYADTLTKTVAAVREYAANPNMTFLVVQTTRLDYAPGREPTVYLGRIRAAQWEAVMRDPNAILIPTMHYNLRDSFRLRDDAMALLGLDIGITLASREKGRTVWFGPKLAAAHFTDATRRHIDIRFDNVERLVLGDNPARDWHIVDENYLGYTEAPRPFIKDNILYLQLEGGRLDKILEPTKEGMARVQLKNTGFLPVQNVSLRSSNVVRVTLADAAKPGARLWHGLWDNFNGSLRDGDGRRLGSLGPIVVLEPPVDGNP
jgi:hypothetical protein